MARAIQKPRHPFIPSKKTMGAIDLESKIGKTDDEPMRKPGPYTFSDII